MAFDKEKVRTPNAIGEIKVVMTDPDPTIAGDAQTVFFEVEVRFSDGSVGWRRGNLLPELTTPQKNQLATFMASMRTKAVAEFLP